LEGITRDTVLQLARELGLSVIEDLVTRDELYIADEVFFTGTAAQITPIVEVDDRKVGNGKVGFITKTLQKYFFKIVSGEVEKFFGWLTWIK
jgi:branched-chain amino acid aminotransferase